jgi:hypothetical protein
MIEYLFFVITISYLYSIFLLTILYFLTGFDMPGEGCMYVLIAIIARSLISYPKSEYDKDFKEEN